MRSTKQKLLSLLLALALVAGLMPAAAFAQQPQPAAAPAAADMPRGITPDWPLASGEPLDLPVVQAEPLIPEQLEVPANLDTLFGYQQLATPAQRNFYLALYTAIRQAERGRPMPFQLDVDLGAPATGNEMLLARELYLKDHPLDSWIVGYCNAYSYGTSAYLQMNGHPAYDKQAFDTQFAKLLHAADGLTTDYEKALALHDALADHVTYDQDAFERQEQDVRHPTFHAYGAIVDQLCVCDGYARAYQALLNAVGIPAFRVLGMQHAWNMVVLDGKYYYTDVTWDDADETFHAYFNLPYNLISQDHFPYPDQGYQLPAQANPDDMSMMYQQMVFTADYTAAEPEILKKAVSTPARHKKTVELYFTGPELYTEPETFQRWSQAGGPLRVWEALCGPDPWQSYNMLTYNMKRSRVMLFSENPTQTTVSLPAKLELPAAEPGQIAWAELPCSIQRSYSDGETLTDQPERMEIKSAQGTEGIRYANGTVRVSSRAAAGVYDLSFFVDGISVSCQLTIEKAPAFAAAAELSDGVPSMAVPRPGMPAHVSEQPLKLTVYDQYGTPITAPLEKVEWTLSPAAGASIDPETRLVTITDQAAPGTLTVSVTAQAGGRQATASCKIELLKDTSNVASLTVSGPQNFAVLPERQTRANYTVTALDAQGSPVPLDPAQLKWTLEPACYGVTLEPRQDSPAAQLTIATDAESCEPVIQVQYGDQKAVLELLIRRLPPVLSEVRYFENSIYDAITGIVVDLPESGTVTRVIYAETNDQYGMQMSGSFQWGLTGPGADKVTLAPLAQDDPLYKQDYLGIAITFPAQAASGSYQLSLRQNEDGQAFPLSIQVNDAAKPQPETDKTQLNKLIAQAGEKQAFDYTAASFDALTKALQGARTVSEDPKATAEQVKAAADALNTALNGLNTTFTWSGSLSLGDRIGVNFYGDFSPALAKDAVVVITVEGEAPVKIPVASVQPGEYGRKFSTSVSVRQMTTPITIQVMQGSQLIGSTYRVSVRKYADVLLKRSSDEIVNRLVYTMLYHGAAMQQYKQYNPEQLATDHLSPAIVEALDADAQQITAKSLNRWVPRRLGICPAGITLYGTNLDLAERTTLKYYFTLADGKTADDYIFAVNSKPVTAQLEDSYLCISVDGIAARQLDEDVELMVSDGTNTWCLYYSPLAYARTAIANHTATEQVARSLVLYSQAADRYADRQ